MSNPSTPHADGANQQSKQMSSRLMTMKFMQRSSPANGKISQPGTPSSEPPSKRRRVETSSNASTPNAPTPKPQSYISRFGVGAALRMRPALEEIASQRVTPNNASETQWVLDVPLPTPEPTSDDDGEVTEEEEIDWNDTSGRQTYGAYKKKKTTPGKTADSKVASYGKHGDQYGLSDLQDEDEEGEVSEGASSDEEEDSDSFTKARQNKQKASAMDYSSENALAALDKVDLSKSSYAKSKGAYVPNGRAGSGGRFGHNGPSPGGKFKNKDKIQKNTKFRNR